MAVRLKPRDRLVCPRCLGSFTVSQRLVRCGKGCGFGSQVPGQPLSSSPVQSAEDAHAPSAQAFEFGKGATLSGLARTRDWFRSEAVAACPSCGSSPAVWVCPVCRADLPTEESVQQVADAVLMGPAGAGKSTYLAVALTELEKHGNRQGFLLDPADESTRNRFSSRYTEPAYGLDQIPPSRTPPTPSYQEKPEVSLSPLMFRIRGTAGGPEGKSRTSWLSLFDSAGIDWEQRRDLWAENAGFLERSNGIMLMIDPTRIVTVREELRRRAGRYQTVPGLDERIERRPIHLADEVRGLGMVMERASRKLSFDHPVAVVLSKLDIWGQVAEPGTVLAEMADHGAIDLPWTEAIEMRVHEEIEALLVRWTGEAFLQQLEHKFPKHRFFAISALGIGAAVYPTSAPHPAGPWITRPLRWLLENQGLLLPEWAPEK